MALLELNFYSKALKTNTAVTVILPEKSRDCDGVGVMSDTPYKTLYLLHGRNGNHTDWMRKSSIERYADGYGIAVIMPEVGRSWYTDTAYGANYFTFITKELPEFCQSCFKGISGKREDTMIAGLSMGGYGALKAALTYPETYGYCASLSGALDITRKGLYSMLDEWKAFFDFNMESELELEGTKHDVFALARKNHGNGSRFPRLYLWCGTEDVLIKINRDYRDMLEELNIEHCYQESEGDHTWKWWDLHIQDALEYLMNTTNNR